MREDGSLYFLPAACLDEFAQPWSMQASKDRFRRDIRDPNVLAEAWTTYRSCLQNNALHELGHVAGFAHEQYRQDDPTTRALCTKIIEARGLADDLASVPAESRGDLALGTFDRESIMSYCRLDKRPTLTAEDVRMTNVAYGARRDDTGGNDTDDSNDDGDGPDGLSIGGGTGGKGGEGGDAY